MTAPLMPKATAVWLVENTALSFDQIAYFCNLHPLEVKAIADGDAAQGIKGLDPVQTGQLTREQIDQAEGDPEFKLKLTESKDIASGQADVIIAGGMEHMTGAPYVVKSARWGQRLGNTEMIDTLVNDALWDMFYDIHMGTTAENVADKFHISREEQDAFAAASQAKTEQSIKEGKFKEEIVPLMIKQPRGADKVFDTDEHPRFGTTVESLAKLAPAFKKEGTVTAGNASGVNDGAAAVLVVSKAKMKELKPAWAFRITGASSSALDPAFMGLGPITACRSLVARAKCSVHDLDLIEINEAFASQSIQVHREMEWDMNKVNVLGGAIALGHPVGASGTRILVTLIYEMVRRDTNLGLASLCIGGGQGIAMIIERVR